MDNESGVSNTVLIILSAFIVVAFFVLLGAVTAKIHHRGHFLPQCTTTHKILCAHPTSNSS